MQGGVLNTKSTTMRRESSERAEMRQIYVCIEGEGPVKAWKQEDKQEDSCKMP